MMITRGFGFTHAVMRALGATDETLNDFELAQAMEEKTGMPVPDAVKKLKDAKVRHTTVCARSEIKKQIRSFLQLTDA